MKKLSLISTVIVIAISGIVNAQPIQFLEEKTAFCYSEKSLAKYLHFASKHNIDGMNELVLNGECDFVPDGQIVRLQNYRIDSVGKTKIVEFELNNQSLWTVNSLVQSADFGD